ncbi:MAG: hypothetical protein V3T77_11115 [Planctomycetota bacterium]
MSPPLTPQVDKLLRLATRRWFLQGALSKAAWGAAAVLLTAGSLVVAHRLLSPEWALGPALGIWLGAALPLAGLVALGLAPRDRLRAVLQVERHYQLHERLSTILFLESEPASPEATEALLRDGERHAGRVELSRAMPYQRPFAVKPALASLLLLLGVYLLLPSFDLWGLQEKRDEIVAEKRRVTERKERFRKRMKRLEEIARKDEISPQTRKLLAQMAKRPPVERSDRRPEAERRRALVNMQKLTDQVQQRLASSDMKKLHTFLDNLRSTGTKFKTEQAKQVAKALSEGDLAKASNALRDMASKLSAQGLDARAQAALKADLNALLRKLGDLPSLDRKLAEALSQLGSDDLSGLGKLPSLLDGAASDLADLARLLREKDLLNAAQQEISFTQDELAQLPQDWPEDLHFCPECGKPGGT